jgi:hypothetical protein
LLPQAFLGLWWLFCAHCKGLAVISLKLVAVFCAYCKRLAAFLAAFLAALRAHCKPVAVFFGHFLGRFGRLSVNRPLFVATYYFVAI